MPTMSAPMTVPRSRELSVDRHKSAFSLKQLAANGGAMTWGGSRLWHRGYQSHKHEASCPWAAAWAGRPPNFTNGQARLVWWSRSRPNVEAPGRIRRCCLSTSRLYRHCAGSPRTHKNGRGAVEAAPPSPVSSDQPPGVAARGARAATTAPSCRIPAFPRGREQHSP